jgi:Domain of unknown function (DUF2019)
MSNRISLSELSVTELAQRFLSLTLGQYEAERRSENTKYNRLYAEMRIVRNELKHREGDQRRALLPYINHENAQVRLMAASSLLTIAPEQARRALKSVRESGIVPQSVDAGFLLDGLEDGSFVPK